MQIQNNNFSLIKMKFGFQSKYLARVENGLFYLKNFRVNNPPRAKGIFFSNTYKKATLSLNSGNTELFRGLEQLQFTD